MTSKPPLADTYTLGKTITHDTDAEGAVNALMAAGWENIGDGTYTTVLLSPDGQRVLKFASGRGQRATVEAALAQPDNPHLPRIFGVLDLEGDEFAYEAEALEQLEDEEDDLYARDGGGDYEQPDFRAWADKWSPDLFDYAPSLFKGRPNGPMKDAVRAVIGARDKYFSGKWGWDIHPGNLMRRPSDGALVLNDLMA